MIKNYVDDLNANIYLTAAEDIGLNIEIINKPTSFARIFNARESYYLVENALYVNQNQISRISRSKFLSSIILKPILGNLIPNSILINLDNIDWKLINNFFEKNKEIVIKPNEGSLAQGVLVLPKSINEISKHLDNLRINIIGNKFVIIEEYSNAKREFRFLVYKGKIIDVIERFSANITGNGSNTIQELINQKNKEKESQNLPKIVVDNNHLKSQKLSSESILEDRKRITLNKVCNMGMGGDVNYFNLQDLNPKFKTVMSKTLKHSTYNYIGVDVMSDDLTQDPYTNNSIINEINSAPMPELSYFARINENDPLIKIKELLKEIFKIN